MKHPKEYEPFGQEWKDHLMMEPKKFIIDMFKGCCQQREKLQEQNHELLEALKKIIEDCEDMYDAELVAEDAIKKAEGK